MNTRYVRVSSISDIGGDIGDMRAYRAFVSDTIYNEILMSHKYHLPNKNDIICLQRQ